ncbi:hypothetical protein [Zavarzinia sp.]|uniref:hypothetical protein n=1 Tax=Zavarzinia sp. TaxID=2027920 RepID=UPI00356B41C2
MIFFGDWRKVAACVSLLLVCSCAGAKPTSQITRNLVTYKIAGTAYERVADAVTKGLQGSNADAVRVDRSLLPANLPDAPGRLELKNPIGGNLGTLLAGQGQRLQIPACDNAPYIATGSDQSFARYGESTGYYVCLWAYKDGVSLDIFTAFEIRKGGVENIGQDLARAVLGDSSQFIQKSIDNMLNEVRATGAAVTKVAEQRA